MQNIGLLGFKAQKMGGPRDPKVFPVTTFVAPVTTRTQEWVCPQTGKYRWFAHGRGGDGYSGGGGYAGGSGGLAVKDRIMRKGEIATISIPSIGSAGNTTVTFSDGSVITGGAGGIGALGSGGAGGTATGGDVNIAGTAGALSSNAGNPGGGSDGGEAGPSGTGTAGAPGYDGIRGGSGGPTTGGTGGTPGGSGKSSSSTDIQRYGGQGQVVVKRIA
jgi:hypothetical protein